MPLKDADFARVLNQLYVISRDSHFDDEPLAESLIRAAVVILSVSAETGPTAEIRVTAETMLERSFEWYRRMTPNR
ncbi:MAG: hypothetical protein WCF85_12590 [Rhodospirillaceae bacterium]